MSSANRTRVRFAPSPTGYLHVGGARTALFNWLYARKTGGSFLLRIEDTDRQRSSEEHTRIILDGLRWLGLDWDEEVAFQGARLARHQEAADRLLSTDHAYSDNGAIRFRVPAEELAWDDAIHGRIAFHGSDISDLIILRSDRTPTYNFSVVVDDVDMDVTHVIRGDDHISNTPKQIAIYRALEQDLPTFGHVPMIHGMDGKKLSKRHGATAVGDYQKLGILPDALRNFLALLGWSPGNDRELFVDALELINAFDLDGVQKKSAIFDHRKLEWMNGQYISQTPPDELLPLVQAVFEDRELDEWSAEHADRVRECIGVLRNRARTTLELADRILVRLKDAPAEPEPKAVKFIHKAGGDFEKARLAVIELLRGLEAQSVTPDSLDSALSALAESVGLSRSAVYQTVRIALTGGTVSEPVTDLVPLVGREESIRRLERSGSWVEGVGESKNREPGN